MKILIIDDDLTTFSCFLEVVANQYMLEYKFFKENPMDALPYILSHEVEGVFLGSVLEVKPLEFAKKLIEIKRDLKIVFIHSASDLNEENYLELLPHNYLGTCMKPLDTKQIDSFIYKMKASEKRIIVKTFGSFDVFINRQLINFKSAKSKELFALLIVYNGKTLNMSDAICHLWPDKELDRAKRLYRDAVWKLRKTLIEYDLLSYISFKRAQLFLHKKNIKCDYWDYLNDQNTNYNGMFLSSYDWSIEFQLELDSMKTKRKSILKF